MIALIAFGFCLIFLLSYWFSARVGARRQSAVLGLAAGVLSYVVMLCVYLIALALWARAQLLAFINNELPMLVERAVGLVDRLSLIRDTL